MMRTKAIIKIVIWSIVVVLLTTLLSNLLTSRNVSGWYFSSYYKPGTENYNVGNLNTAELSGEEAVDITRIKNVSVDWIKGEVTIVPSDEQQIVMTETYVGEISSSEKMRWDISADSLDVIYRKSSRSLFETNVIPKNLEIKIPRTLLNTLDSFNFNSVSAELSASEITSKKVTLDTVSGDMTIIKSKTEELITNSVSGEVIFGIVTDKADCDTVSGDVELTLDNASDITFNGISASLMLFIPDNQTFSVDLDSVSGSDKNIDVELMKNKLESGAKTDIRIDTVSGDIIIKKSN